MTPDPETPAAAGDPWKSFRGVMAGTLILELITVLLALPVVGADPQQIRVAYRQFLLQARPRAFLITSDSRFGTATSSAALTEHLKGCTQRKVVCAAYAVDNTVVWGKQQAAR